MALMKSQLQYRQSFRIPQSIKLETPILNMIHRYNIAELSLVDRPVRGPDAGFGSIVNKHNEGHDRPYRETAKNDAFGYEKKLSA